MSDYQNPAPTVDAIISDAAGKVVLILRKNEPHGWALPGGFVDQGEELGNACRREALEETSLEVQLEEQLFTYSDPKRDPRKHTISTVYACTIPTGPAGAGGELRGADDAREARWFGESEIPWAQLCFDHAQILRDYFVWRKTGQRRRL